MRYTTTLVLLLAGCSLFSQNIVNDLLWAKEFRDAGLGNLLIETDSNDNIIVAATYEGCPYCYTAWADDTLFTGGANLEDVFVAKIDPNGNLLWYQLIGEAGDEALVDMKVDHDNQILLYLRNGEPFSYASTVMEPGHNLLKLNENGQLVWHRNIKGAWHFMQNSQLINTTEQMSISCQNDIVIGGSVDTYLDLNTIVDTLIFGPDTFYQYLQLYDQLEVGNLQANVDTNNFFIVKIDSQGNPQWLKTFEHPGYVEAASINVAGDLKINVLGSYSMNDLQLGSATLPVGPNPQKNTLFVMQLDADGTQLWAHPYFYNAQAVNLTSDPQGNIVAIGYFQPFTIFGQDTLKIVGNADDFVLFKLDASGNYLWGKRAGDQTTNQTAFAQFNSDGGLYLSGNLSSHNGVIMNKYDGNGNLLWQLNPTQSVNRNGGDIAFDRSGNLIQTGIFSGQFIIGNYTLPTSLGNWHEYLLKFKNQTAAGWTPSCNDIISGLNDVVASSMYLVFPNPTDGTLSVYSNDLPAECADYLLYDWSGKFLTQYSRFNAREQMVELETSGLAAGVYILKVMTKNGAWSERIIKL